MTTIRLPLAPSANALTRNTSARERAAFVARGFKPKARVKTQAYRAWRDAAGWELKRQFPAPVRGPVDIVIEVSASRLSDSDNRVKPTIDLLVLHQIIDDDKHVRDVTVRRRPFDGEGWCVVTVTPVDDKAKEWNP